MKIIVSLFMMIPFFISPLQSDAYIVFGSNDGSIIEASNEDVPQSVASISKIMTAVIALEYGDFNDAWIIKDEIRGVEGSSIYLQVNQKVTMRSLIYGLMLKSGNDAAVAIAHRVAGSVDKFVKMMNQKAQVIGMKNSIFHNPHGLDVSDDGNISTAYDMALLMQHAMKIETFKEIVKTQHYRSEWGERWKNSNKLLNDFAFVTGGKTGYTSKAGETLVTVAKKEELEIIVVTLSVPNRWQFHKTHYQEVLNDYHVYNVLKEGIYEIQGYEVEIKEAFEVIANDQMQKAGVFHGFLDLNKNEYVVSWKSGKYEVIKRYAAKKLEKKQFCLWRWCW